ncbi:MAG: hypothetical protein AB1921_05350, partial [Thermodesulfobacteriota bacterium]
MEKRRRQELFLLPFWALAPERPSLDARQQVFPQSAEREKAFLFKRAAFSPGSKSFTGKGEGVR